MVIFAVSLESGEDSGAARPCLVDASRQSRADHRRESTPRQPSSLRSFVSVDLECNLEFHLVSRPQVSLDLCFACTLARHGAGVNLTCASVLDAAFRTARACSGVGVTGMPVVEAAPDSFRGWCGRQCQ